MEDGGSLSDIARSYIDAVCAVAEATDQAAQFGRAPMSAGMAAEYVGALRRMTVMQREAIAVFDSFVARADQIGIAWEEVALLRETRAGLMLGLQEAIGAIEHVDRARPDLCHGHGKDGE